MKEKCSPSCPRGCRQWGMWQWERVEANYCNNMPNIWSFRNAGYELATFLKQKPICRARNPLKKFTVAFLLSVAPFNQVTNTQYVHCSHINIWGDNSTSLHCFPHIHRSSLSHTHTHTHTHTHCFEGSRPLFLFLPMSDVQLTALHDSSCGSSVRFYTPRVLFLIVITVWRAIRLPLVYCMYLCLYVTSAHPVLAATSQRNQNLFLDEWTGLLNKNPHQRAITEKQ